MKKLNCLLCVLLTLILLAVPVTGASAAEIDNGSVKISAYLNGNLVKEAQVKDTLIISYNLKAPMMIEDGQGTLTYDSEKLELVDLSFPNINSSLTINENFENAAKFNFTGVESKTRSGKFDFRDGAVFAQAEFRLKDNVSGGAEINLFIEELDALENDNEVEYIANSKVTTAGNAVFASLLSPAVALITPPGVKVISSLNNEVVNETSTEDTIIVTFKLKAPMLIEDGQGTLTYDSSKLTLVDFSMPNITSALMINDSANNKVSFNFTGVDAKTGSGKFDFLNEEIFVQAEFKTTDNAYGSTNIDLKIEELDALENGEEVELIASGEFTPEGKTVKKSLSEPSVELDNLSGVKVLTSLNNITIDEAQAEDTVTVTYNLTSPMMIEDGQGTLTYDSSKLTLVDFSMPNITSSLTVNDSFKDKVTFNFTGVDSKTNSGKFDFKDGGVFIKAEFKVNGNASGTAKVNLKIEELDALENGKEVDYASGGEATPQGSDIISSLSNPTVQLDNQTGVKVFTSFNGKVSDETQAEDIITISYNLKSAVMIEDGQGTLTYDSSKLELIDFTLPNITSGLTVNENVKNAVKFNFTGVDSKTNSGKFDFKDGGVFVQAKFRVLDGASGSTKVGLNLEELDAMENGEEIEYITGGRATDKADEVIASLKAPSITAEKPSIPETSAPETESAEETEALTQPREETTSPETTEAKETIPETEVVTAAPEETQPEPTEEAPEKAAQKITAKSFTKTNGCDKFNLHAKTSGNGKLTYKSSKTSVASVSKKGTITVNDCGKATITITASETAEYKSAVKKITVTVKPAAVKIKDKSFKKKTITLKIGKQNGVSGYELEVSKKSGFSSKFSKTFTPSKTKLTIKSLGKGKKNYVRVRAFVKTDGGKLYSKWTKTAVKLK